MYYPGQVIDQEWIKFFLAILQTNEVKAELAKQTRIEIDNQRRKNLQPNVRGGVQSYESLISGDVNMQMRMAASGYDVYGHTYIGRNQPFSNQNAYRNLKNSIRYGKAPQKARRNRGSYNIV